MWRPGRIFMVCVLALLICFRCARPAATEITIDFWAMGVEARYVQEIVPRFERENPGIKVRVQSIPWLSAHEKLLTAFAGNSTPDLCQLGNTWIPEFTALEALEALEVYVEKSTEIDSTQYFSGIWQTNIIDQNLYGIPWYVDTRLLFYRSDIFKELGYSTAPETWPEFLELSRKIVAQRKTEYAILLPLNGWHEFVIIALESGSRLLREEDCYGDFENPAFRRAFEFYLHFYEEGLCPKGMTEVSNIYQSFAENYFAIYITGPWNLGEYRDRLPQSMQDRWTTAPMPAFGEAGPGLSTAGGSSVVMFRNSPHKEAVWRLMEFLAHADVQAEFYRLSGDLPANIVAWDLVGLRENPRTEAFYRQLQKVVPTPKIPEWEQIANKIQQYVESVVFGELTVAEAGRALNRDVDNLLDKRRWLRSRKEP